MHTWHSSLVVRLIATLQICKSWRISEQIFIIAETKKLRRFGLRAFTSVGKMHFSWTDFVHTSHATTLLLLLTMFSMFSCWVNVWATELRRHTVKSGKTASYSTAIYMMLLTMFSIIQLPDNVSLHCKKRKVVFDPFWLLQFHTLLDNSKRITLPWHF